MHAEQRDISDAIPNVRDVARAAYRAGLCVVPPREDGTKAPLADDGQWKRWQSERPDPDQLKAWYSGPRSGVGIVTGTISGDVELFEFDNADTYAIYRDTGDGAGLNDIIRRVEAGYSERTPSGGIHWLWRCEAVAPSGKLARRHGEINPETGKPRIVTLIETKGQGGYAVLAPSWGRVHPSGRPYELLAGGVGSIATITPDERAALLQLARAFDELPKPEPIGPATSARHAGKRPGDEFNARATWEEVLIPHGWVAVYRQGGKVAWRRPGKDVGISATTNWHDSDLLYVFSTSTAFESEQGYSKWRAYAILNHGGDFEAAARELGALGYGSTPLPAPLRLRAAGGNTNEQSSDAESQPATFPYTDTGNAERLVARHGADLRHCRLWGKWLAWDGTRWRMDDTGEVERRAKETVRAIVSEALDAGLEGDAFAKALKWAAGSDAAQRRMAMVRLAESEPDVAVLPDGFDRDPWLLTVANGTLDLRDASLRPHRRADLITRAAVVAYDPDAACPAFERFLGQITADPESGAARHDLADFLRRAVGYSLTGVATERVMLILHGRGANGKSTFLEIVRELLGDFATRVPTETLMAKRGGGGIPNDIARLKGARFVFAAETDEGRRLSEALIKDLTGTDTISARFMRGEFFDFKPEFKLWLATNHKPNIRGTDPAIWDRIRLIPFDVRIAPEQQDRHLLDKLRAELPGILAWAVRGCLEWQRDGLGYPAVIRAATSGYRAEMDVLETWLADCCEIDDRERATSKDLYASYKAWCEDTGERALRQRDFGVKLTERGFGQTRAHGGVRVWTGVRLLSQAKQVTLNPLVTLGDATFNINESTNSLYRGNHSQRHPASPASPEQVNSPDGGDDDDFDY